MPEQTTTEAAMSELAMHLLRRANYRLMHKPLREWGDPGDMKAGRILLNKAEEIYEEMDQCQ